MKNTIETKCIKILPSRTIELETFKIFTYPTRLADVYQPQILQIYVPGYSFVIPEINITAYQGSTRSLEILTRNPLRRWYKKYAKSIDIQENYIFDARYDHDGNIAHLLMNIAPIVLAVKNIDLKITVIFKSNAAPLALKTFQLLNVSTLCTDRDIEGEIISAPRNSKYYSVWYNSLFNKINFLENQLETPEKIFISRRGSRTLTNEIEIEELLIQYGFQKFYYEDIPLEQQWLISKNARFIVAIHGAALASLVFNRHQVKLLELLHPGYVSHTYRFVTYAIGGHYCAVTGQITESVIKKLDFQMMPRSFAASSFKVSLDSLKMALDYLEIT